MSGGAIASMLANEKVNDYDIYFKTKETTLAVAKYYVEVFNKNQGILNHKCGAPYNPEIRVETRTNIKGEREERIIIYMKSAGVAVADNEESYEYFEYGDETTIDKFFEAFQTSPVEVVEELVEVTKDKKKLFKPVFISENAITLSGKIQIVTRFFGFPDQILGNYDYAHAMCYYDYKKNELVLHPEALECILSKTLVYKGSLYPIASLFRIRKFIQRGWRISAGQILKIVWQLNEVDLSDRAVLREQLIGVDQAYMTELLRALENVEGRVDATYIAKLIDEIFE